MTKEIKCNYSNQLACFIEVKIALKIESSFPNFSHSRCFSSNFSSVQQIFQFSKVDINVTQGKHEIPFLFISYSFQCSNSFAIAFAITQLGSYRRKCRREMNTTKVWTQVNRSQQFGVVRRQREREREKGVYTFSRVQRSTPSSWFRE